MKKYLLPILACSMLMACDNPFKVTDPSDPRFDPMQFEFNDYENHEELAPVLREMFPPGTPKEYVEKILVRDGVAEIAGVGSVKERIKRRIHNFGIGNGLEKAKSEVESLSTAKNYTAYLGPSGYLSQWRVVVIYDGDEKVVDLVSGSYDLVHNSIDNDKKLE